MAIKRESKGEGSGENIFEKLIGWGFSVIAFFTPLFFLPTTFEAVQFPKQVLFSLLSILLAVLWFGGMFSKKTCSYKKSVLNIVIPVFLVLYAAATAFSLSPYMSLGSAAGAEDSSLLTMIALALFFFVGVNALSQKQLVRAMWAFLFSSFIAGVFAVLQIFGVFVLPFNFTKAATFNTIGTLNALGVFLIPSFTLSLVLFFWPGQTAVLVKKIFLAALALLAFFVFILLDYWVIWVGVLVAAGCVFIFGTAKSNESNSKWLMAPMAVIALSILFLFIESPVNVNTALEVMPSQRASFDIARQTLTDKAFFGSGPGTYAFDYAKYHSSDINATAFWSVRFNQASSAVLTLLPTIGIVGTIGWLAFILLSGYLLFSGLLRGGANTSGFAYLGVVASWFAVFVMQFLYTSSFTLNFLFWFLLAIGFSLLLKERRSVVLEGSYRGSLVVSFLFILFIVASFGIAYFTVQKYRGEAYFKDYLVLRSEENGLERGVISLAQAVAANGKQDAYYRSVAQAQQQRILEMTAQEVKEDQVEAVKGLIASGMDAAQQAVKLSAENPANWAVLAGFYSAVTPFVQGAGDSAATAFERAIALDPSNPQFYTDYGAHYLGVREILLASVPKNDSAKEKEAKAKGDEYLEKASQQFAKALELKKDFVPAYYYNAILLAAKGDKTTALSQLELGRAYQPSNVDVSYRLGLLYYDNGEKDKAIAELERTIKLVPNHLFARWFLSSIYEEKGDRAKAIEHLEKILEVNPTLDAVKQKLESLKNPNAATTSESNEE